MANRSDPFENHAPDCIHDEVGISLLGKKARHLENVSGLCHFDDSHSPFDEITKLKEDLRHRLTLDRLNVAECYQKGDLNIVVCLRLRDEIVAYVMAAIPGEWTFGDRAGDPGYAISGSEQIGVFVDQVQVVERTQEIAVPSVIWLQCGYGVSDLDGDLFAFLPELSLEPRLIPAMREIRLLRRLTRQYGATTDRLVESTTHIVEGVGGSQPHVGGQWWHRPKLDLGFPRLTVRLSATHLSIGFREGFECDAVIEDVAFGPFNL